MSIAKRLGIIEAPSYHTYYPASNERTAHEFLKSHKDKSCSRQLAIFANELNTRSGRKELRCIINCWQGQPSTLIPFSESGNEQVFALLDDYTERLPQRDARALARVKRSIPVIVERF